MKYAKKIHFKHAWQQKGFFCVDFYITVCGLFLSASVTKCYFQPSSLNIRHSHTPANRTPHDFGHHKRVKVQFKLTE